MCFLWSLIVVSVAAKQLKAGCFLKLKFIVFRQESKALCSGNKNFQGPFTRYRNEFCSRTSSSRLPPDTRVKFIRNQSFLNEFSGYFLSRTKHSFETTFHTCVERGTTSWQDGKRVHCKYLPYSARVFRPIVTSVGILLRSEGSIEKDRKGHKYLQANYLACKHGMKFISFRSETHFGIM